jgi:hypothetical protein
MFYNAISKFLDNNLSYVTHEPRCNIQRGRSTLRETSGTTSSWHYFVAVGITKDDGQRLACEARRVRAGVQECNPA